MKQDFVFNRPYYHHIIIAGYGLAPIVNVALFAFTERAPFLVVIKYFFQFFGTLGGLLILTEPLIALGLYVTRRRTFYAFLLHCALLLFDNTMKALALRGFYHVSLLLGNLMLIGLVLIVMRKDFRIPYFQRVARLFRRYKRIPLLTANIAGSSVEIRGLSRAGFFVPKDSLKLDVDQAINAELSRGENTLSFAARVLRINSEGAAVNFTELSDEQLAFIQGMLRDAD